MRPLRLIVAVIVAALAIPAASSAQRLPADSLERVRRYTDWFVKGTIDSVWAHVNERGRGAIRSRDMLLERYTGLSDMGGAVLGITEERFVWRNGARQYWRTMRMARAPELVVLRFVIGADGELEGMGVNLVSGVPPVDSGGPPIKPRGS